MSSPVTPDTCRKEGGGVSAAATWSLNAPHPRSPPALQPFELMGVCDGRGGGSQPIPPAQLSWPWEEGTPPSSCGGVFPSRREVSCQLCTPPSTTVSNPPLLGNHPHGFILLGASLFDRIIPPSPLQANRTPLGGGSLPFPRVALHPACPPVAWWAAGAPSPKEKRLVTPGTENHSVAFPGLHSPSNSLSPPPPTFNSQPTVSTQQPRWPPFAWEVGRGRGVGGGVDQTEARPQQESLLKEDGTPPSPPLRGESHSEGRRGEKVFRSCTR